MSDPLHVDKPPYRLASQDAAGLEPLVELALDMRWSWNHATDRLWRELDAELWELTHNPWVVLQTVSRERIERMLADPAFRRAADRLLQDHRRAVQAPGWFQECHAPDALSCVAYFCMEFMLSEALPIYSGGLGNVAGDQLKSASDLGVPVVGVGLLYQQGYFRQVIDADGAQQALYPYNDPGQLPITPLRRANGDWLRLEFALPGYAVWLRAWQVRVGRVKLYLLDSNDAANFPAHRGITSELYGGGPELRLTQELLLGIGGWRLLEELGLRPEVCHLNEGHAAFAVLERARGFMRASGQPFETALAGAELGAQQRCRVHRVRAQHSGLGEQHLHAASFDAQYGAEAEFGFGGGDPALTRYEHHSAVLHQRAGNYPPRNACWEQLALRTRRHVPSASGSMLRFRPTGATGCDRPRSAAAAQRHRRRIG